MAFRTTAPLVAVLAATLQALYSLALFSRLMSTALVLAAVGVSLGVLRYIMLGLGL